ncbi:hypothetical protein [Cognatishimia sp.]|uniref:hypothetical protein n=1 Tax=Cognatishimia sp. TaxID=2211648 RepID=UPI0035124EEE|nr:hypothetical protein [Cognatishimia sp.]NQY58547.1 hypothetical protein [Cognatishimia sp.]
MNNLVYKYQMPDSTRAKLMDFIDELHANNENTEDYSEENKQGFKAALFGMLYEINIMEEKPKHTKVVICETIE